MDCEKKNIKLTIAYDGTHFHGFQKQEDGIRTVQGEIDRAFHELTGETPESVGSARTDTGVHAMGNVMSFLTATTIPPESIAPALGHLLPEDLSAMRSREVPHDFSARFSATGKEYHYYFCHSPAPVPILRNSSLFLRRKPDLEAMRTAGQHLLGERDFSCFRNEGSTPSKPIRRIDSVTIEERDCLIALKVRGSGFLYKMVRNIAGTLLEVGRGRFASEDIPGLLESRDRTLAGPTLPPHGLFLMKVYFD